MMTRWIIETSLRFRLLVLAIAVDVMALGVTQLRKAPVDALPEFTPAGASFLAFLPTALPPLPARSPETARIAGGLGE
jgi:Cu/Ag efflux pump CusA